MVVDSRPEEMMDSSTATSSSNRRQDQQDDIGANSPTTPYFLQPIRSRTHLVFNTFRSHLSVLRASVTERDEDHYVPHETAAVMLASNNNRYHKTSMKEDDDMTWSEKLFVSPEDELVGENEWQKRMYGIGEEDAESEQHQLRSQQRQPHEVKAEFNFEDATTNINITSGDHQDDSSERTDDCTHLTKVKRRKRGKKARDASMVGAFVTFLKALFGIGMLSNPAVLGETGLILGTFNNGHCLSSSNITNIIFFFICTPDRCHIIIIIITFCSIFHIIICCSPSSSSCCCSSFVSFRVYIQSSQQEHNTSH